eukprot:TRINITY_DN3500_c1_g1_i1.p1 TRINITY_DN3500_c1_g1~~TRINITY_DN3500_c1_g1_i1.p1  ORF type:complete len:104 (-),score=1.38 TRINITY_DN3500_c1_g1_i1:174-485(-)
MGYEHGTPANPTSSDPQTRSSTYGSQSNPNKCGDCRWWATYNEPSKSWCGQFMTVSSSSGDSVHFWIDGEEYETCSIMPSNGWTPFSFQLKQPMRSGTVAHAG